MPYVDRDELGNIVAEFTAPQREGHEFIEFGERWSPPLTGQQRSALLSDLITQRLNAFAATRRYDSVDSMAKYKDLSDAEIESLPAARRPIVYRYRAEVRYLLLKTAETWAAAELIEARALAGNWPTNGAGQVPSSIEDIQADLPTLAWPA